MTTQILTVLSGINHPDSLTRAAAKNYSTVLAATTGAVDFVIDLADGTETPPVGFPHGRSIYVEDVLQSDVIVIAAPIYNFSIPAALKLWIDQIAVAGTTFDGETWTGLLTGKRVVVFIASGGVEIGSDYDFATPYLRHFFGFLGITDVEFVKV